MFEVISKEVDSSHGWMFHAVITVTIQNQGGRDFIKVCDYRFGPKQTGITASREKVHASTYYWLPEKIIQAGTQPFSGDMEKFDTEHDAAHEEELLQDCIDHAVKDIGSEIESLKQKDQDIKSKITT